MPSHDRYGSDVLNTDWRAPRRGRAVEISADKGLVVEEVTTDWCGEIVAVERDLGTVTLEDRRGKRRTFPIGTGFLLEGVPVILVPPARSGPAAQTRTASGSVAVPGTRPASPGPAGSSSRAGTTPSSSRRSGATTCASRASSWSTSRASTTSPSTCATSGPGPERRVGVLVDHLVAGSKESRIAASVAKSPVGKHVLIVGHPFIDIWAAVKPARLGIKAWPTVPRTIEWKHGVCQQLGWPHRDQADIARAWKHILGRVRSFADLEPSLLGRVEELIDFVTSPERSLRTTSSDPVADGSRVVASAHEHRPGPAAPAAVRRRAAADAPGRGEALGDRRAPRAAGDRHLRAADRLAGVPGPQRLPRPARARRR